MTESAKPLYELRPRGKYYQGIWQGEHCLAVICVIQQRGTRDAQFLLRAANSHDELVVLLQAAQCPSCDHSGAYHDSSGEVVQCQWCSELECVLKKAKGE